MTFEDQGAELAKLEALAQSLGMSAIVFERIAIEASEEVQNSSVRGSAAQTLAEIRRQIEPPGTRKPGTL